MTLRDASIAQTPRVRAMAEPSFRDRMHDYASNDRVGPLNRWIATLCDKDRWMPRIAPTYGGVEAEVLFLLQDPGVAPASGGGFLCHQNDDPSAELFARGLDHADLPASRATAWNAYPWYRADHARPSSAEVASAFPVLADLLDRLPRLKVVVPMGRVAQDAWARFAQDHPDRAKAYDCVAAPLPYTRDASPELVGALVEARTIIDAPPASFEAALPARRARRICDRPGGIPADRACRTA
jgi:uracil-DNA glycosylase